MELKMRFKESEILELKKSTAVILFANNPEKCFPNAKLRCAVFGRTDTAYIVDRQEYIGDLFYLINSDETYILEHIDIGMRLDERKRVSPRK